MTKLDRITFANVAAYCVHNGMLNSLATLEGLDNLIHLPPVELRVEAYKVNDLLFALKDGRFIEAIKAYRVLTGASLKESKDVLEKVREVKKVPSHVQPIPLEEKALETTTEGELLQGLARLSGLTGSTPL